MSDMYNNRCPYCPDNNQDGQNNGIQNDLEEYPYLNAYTPLERQLLHEEIYGQATQNQSSQNDSSQSADDNNYYNENIARDTLASFEHAFEQRSSEGASALNTHYERDLFRDALNDSTINDQADYLSSQNSDSGFH